MKHDARTELAPTMFEAATVDEAVGAGLRELGLKAEEAKITVVERGSRGFLGLGARKAKVQVVSRHDLSPELVGLARRILELMGVEARVSGVSVGSEVRLTVESASDGLLIGRRGETLEAFQHVLVRMAGHLSGCNIESVRVDVAGYRDRREGQIRQMAEDLADRVEKTGRRAMTEPLSAAERRLVHRTLAGRHRIETHVGGGTGPNRRVVLRPKGDARAGRRS
jgi:spoIIIJ-associated protein